MNNGTSLLRKMKRSTWPNDLSRRNISFDSVSIGKMSAKLMQNFSQELEDENRKNKRSFSGHVERDKLTIISKTIFEIFLQENSNISDEAKSDWKIETEKILKFRNETLLEIKEYLVNTYLSEPFKQDFEHNDDDVKNLTNIQTFTNNLNNSFSDKALNNSHLSENNCSQSTLQENKISNESLEYNNHKSNLPTMLDFPPKIPKELDSSQEIRSNFPHKILNKLDVPLKNLNKLDFPIKNPNNDFKNRSTIKHLKSNEYIMDSITKNNSNNEKKPKKLPIHKNSVIFNHPITITRSNKPNMIVLNGKVYQKPLHLNQNLNKAKHEPLLKPVCYCEHRTVVKCRHLGTFPSTISEGVTKLVLADNHISHLGYNDLVKYANLTEGLHLQRNKLHTLPPFIFRNQNRLKKLYLSENKIKSISASVCAGLGSLQVLHLYQNGLQKIELKCFEKTPLLEILLLAKNDLTLNSEIFPTLNELKFLDLQRNKISFIGEHLFASLINLETLSLQHNEIKYIQRNSFKSLKSLVALDLSNNKITNVAFIFRFLGHLQSLNLRGLQLNFTSVSDYQNLTSLKRIYFHRNRYCLFVEKVEFCLPKSDGITTRENLMHSLFLRVCVWFVAMVTLTGNIVVILCRELAGNDDHVYVLFIKNLALADLLMGIYLIIVGVQDQLTRDHFFEVALNWSSSVWCTTAGCLAVISSEASVFILAYMSLQKYLSITRTFSGTELSRKFARQSLGVIWVTSVVLALFPVMGMTSFYGVNAMCFPLHINEPYLEGWQFSAFVFLGLNTFSMIVIIFSYIGLFNNIKVTRSKTPMSTTEASFVFRILFIVLTDCVCWLPILAFKIIAFTEIAIPGEVYAWLVVLVLPINSAINPILYTFSTNYFVTRAGKVFKLFSPQWTKRKDSVDTFTLSSSRSRSSIPSVNRQSILTSTPNFSILNIPYGVKSLLSPNESQNEAVNKDSYLPSYQKCKSFVKFKYYSPKSSPNINVYNKSEKSQTQDFREMEIDGNNLHCLDKDSKCDVVIKQNLNRAKSISLSKLKDCRSLNNDIKEVEYCTNSSSSNNCNLTKFHMYDTTDVYKPIDVNLFKWKSDTVYSVSENGK